MNFVPKTITDQLHVIHKDFIWRDKKVKIKHSTLIGEYADGGLRDLGIPSSLTSAPGHLLTFLGFLDSLTTKSILGRL